MDEELAGPGEKVNNFSMDRFLRGTPLYGRERGAAREALEGEFEDGSFHKRVSCFIGKGLFPLIRHFQKLNPPVFNFLWLIRGAGSASSGGGGIF